VKKVITFFGAILFASLFLLSCGNSNPSSEDKAKIIKEYKDSMVLVEKAKQDSIVTSDSKKKIITSPHDEEKLNFEHLYPILKKCLLKVVCDSYRIEEEDNSLIAYSKESNMFLSKWEWDLKDNPLLIKDIDNDGLLDYTIELINEGGGCGGQIGESERWTLFGSQPDRFKWTHVIPYRSITGKWENI
jgi:hypothetical protein